MSPDLDSRRLGERLRLVRIQIFGPWGIPGLARELHIPAKSWCNYERGVTMPAQVLLKFIELTSVDPHWLATGEGPRFRERSPGLDLFPAARDQEQSRYDLGYSVN
jgi:hypothetical protein